MRDVAVVSYAERIVAKSDEDEVEMLVPVLAEARTKSGLKKEEIGFTVSGSCDYLGGRPFSFVMALDAVGAWPPISESHVEMDGAWALYEAWVRLQHGDIDAALVYAFGKPSQGDLRDVLVTQLDPYVLAPLSPSPVAIAGLQARALLDAGKIPARDLPGDELPSRDGVAAIVLAAGDLAKRAPSRAWIRGIDHRIESHAIGARDLTKSVSTELAAQKSGAHAKPVDFAAVHATFAHEEWLVRDALGVGVGVPVESAGSPYIVAGLTRIGAAASRIFTGAARRAVAHASSGPCLQQNLVCVLEAGQ